MSGQVLRTKTSEENQQRIPDAKLESLNTYKDYTKQVNWKINGSKMNEEIVYEYLSSSFTDLVNNVVLSRISQSTSDNYERVTFKAMEDNRMILSRCDYYDKLKCFCITFSSE